MSLKKDLIKYLKTKSPHDIEWVKKDKSIIFEKHNELKEEDANLLFNDFTRIEKVERTPFFDDRLLVLRAWLKHLNIEFIILDPFYENIEKQFKNKVAIITMYTSRPTL